MPRLSLIIITFNEEENIRDCLESAKWADEVVVVDSRSSDRTVDIAKSYTDKVYNSDDNSYSSKRNFAIEKAKGDWILWLDADERITDELKHEISKVINSPQAKYDAFLINRKSYFINKFISHCGWFPDYGLRLFRKSTSIRFDNLRVHEKPVFKGKTGKLNSVLLHYTDLTFEHYISKLNSYTTKSSLDLNDKGIGSTFYDIVFRPVFTFIKMYFLKLGLLDGYTGLVLCTLSSMHVFVKYSKLYFITKKV